MNGIHVECTQPFRKDFYVKMVYAQHETPKCVYGIYLTEYHIACNLQTLQIWNKIELQIRRYLPVWIERQVLAWHVPWFGFLVLLDHHFRGCRLLLVNYATKCNYLNRLRSEQIKNCNRKKTRTDKWQCPRSVERQVVLLTRLLFE